MGGQACVFYGAAEFSRDLDLLILAEDESLRPLRAALDDLNAQPIAVPQLEVSHLRRGHAVHFRCRRPDVAGLRIDLMSSLRGVAAFNALWARRTTLEIEGEPVDLLAIEDLVQAKKTQRDKDWPMLTRLVERSYFERPEAPSAQLVEFWLRELRTPELLIEVAAAHPELAAAQGRSAVRAAGKRDLEKIADALAAEERQEREKDRQYWAPLKRELEQLRLHRPRG